MIAITPTLSLDEREVERFGEKRDGLVVIADDEGDLGDGLGHVVKLAPEFPARQSRVDGEGWLGGAGGVDVSGGAGERFEEAEKGREVRGVVGQD